MAQKLLVTGVSGFIAKHVALAALKAGYEVRGTLRALNKADQVKRSLDDAGADISKLSFAAADLVKDEGWAEAVDGCDGVMHVASPLPTTQPRDRHALTPAARDGALRVLKASRQVERVVMTSSVAAMMYRPNRPKVTPVRETDWTDGDWDPLSPYIVSKVEAEKAAWALATEQGFKHRLITVNPGLVLGPPLDDDIGASLDLIRLLATGAYPALVPASFPIVDVRDVATLHIKAFETPEAGGRRLIAAADTLAIKDIASILKETLPEHAAKLPSRVLPAFVVRLLAMFDRSIASVLADLDAVPQADTAYVNDLTGVTFRSAREAVISAAQKLVDIKAI